MERSLILNFFAILPPATRALFMENVMNGLINPDVTIHTSSPYTNSLNLDFGIYIIYLNNDEDEPRIEPLDHTLWRDSHSTMKDYNIRYKTGKHSSVRGKSMFVLLDESDVRVAIVCKSKTSMKDMGPVEILLIDG